MNHSQSLPEPSSDALSHSEKLISVIREEIESSEIQSISFRRYMEMALYQPGLGYYVAGNHKIGEQGDFITAPEISSLFSQCVANQCSQILQKVGGCLLELGAGSGKMASDILLELQQQNQLPDRYYILDLSPDLIQRQKETIKQTASHLLEKVVWITSPPKDFIGVVLGNEVLDAMPVDVFTQNGNDIFEHHVIWQDEKLVEQLKPANTKLKEQVLALNLSTEKPYTSEINPSINAWLKNLNESIDKGMVLLIDYGYTKDEYYLPERNKGTLICHYQHLVNDAPLHYPGLQDITTNVDFSSVAEGAVANGFQVSGFTSQVHFLANTGLENYFLQVLDKNEENTEEHQFKVAQQVRILSLPSEMGERFKCIALSKGLDGETDNTLLGFTNYDQRFRL